MHVLRTLFWTSRPVLYPIIPAIFLLGWQAGGGDILQLGWYNLTLLVFLTFPLSVLIYGLNDVYDYASDTQNTERSTVGGMVLTPKHHPLVLRAAGSILVLSCGLALLSFSLITLLLMLLIVLACYLYSVPPFRIKSRPIVDALFSGFCCVIPIYALGFTRIAPVSAFPREIFLLAVLAVALHMYLSIRDYTADKLVGDTTTTVLLGKRATAVLVATLTCFSGMAWYVVRPTDYLTLVLFTALFSTAVYTAYTTSERFVKQSMYILLLVGILVMGAKIIW
jgi:4-hydroxybenzoate polyprenyltransferase